LKSVEIIFTQSGYLNEIIAQLTKLFFIEIARQYKLWFHNLSEKRKNKFIPLPWKVGEILLRGISKTDEYDAYFENSNLKVSEEIKGIDPNHLFHNHFLLVGLNPTLLKSKISK
jgi:hypothetical protein